MSPDTLDLRAIVSRIVDDASDRLAADAVAFWLRGGDGSELHLAFAVGFQDPQTALYLAHRPASRLRDWLVGRRLPAMATLKRSDVAGDRAWLQAEGIQALLAVPVVADGQSLGVLAAFRRRRPFTVGSLARAGGLVAAATPAVHAAWRLREQRERAERAETLLAIAQALATTSDPASVLGQIGRHAARAVGAAACDVRLWAVRDPVEPPPASALVVPIARDREIIGRLTLTGPPPSGWMPGAVELATAIAAQIALVAGPGRFQAGAAVTEPGAARQKQTQGETLRALADLAGGAAHHLNNLLTIVVGRVQLVLRSTDDERLLRPLTIVERAARDGAEVVRRLQQFSRMRPVAQPRPVSLDALVGEVLATVPGGGPGGRAAAARIDVESRAGGVPPVAGDAAALREALANIVHNAVDAMPGGGRLVIETQAAGGVVTVTVSDTGVGMSDTVQVRAQEPFFTTKGVKATGLGLSVAYGIVRSHGGDVTIRSAEGAGTTVTVTLPAATDTAEPPPPTPCAARGLNVLLVDDESDVRDALADMLVSHGHAVSTASGGEEALAFVEREPGLDLILTDLVMPGMTGWEVAAAAKARRPHVAVGLVTGWGEPLESADAQRGGIDFVLDKPVTLETLHAALARVRRR
jgi:signal transduction histidine kinase/CheY-like chemotaxis protein